MPSFIRSTLPRCTFHLFKHEQLTIRNMAVKTYTRYLSQCNISVRLHLLKLNLFCVLIFGQLLLFLQVAVDSLHEILLQLCRDVDLTQDLPHLAFCQLSFKYLDPFEAESLLGVCIYLIKVNNIRFRKISHFVCCKPHLFSPHTVHISLYVIHPEG